MNRDPLFPKIEEALKGDLDPALFQACALDLLSSAYPTLAPLVGGNDAGMDGAVGTEKGAFPLVVTTGKDVIRNLTRSLTENRERWSGPRRAVVATSRPLTPVKRRNLTSKAKKLGFVLVNIHDGAHFAYLLYQNPHWRKELLGIAGDSPALSALPSNFRATSCDLIVGRENDLAWLRDGKRDLLLIGQPGSGKTYLHQAMAITGECLFAVDADLGRLADAIRFQNPDVIVVDDAHGRLAFLKELLRLRHELDADFVIHANSWPQHGETVRGTLGLSSGQTRELSRLSKKSLLQVIQGQGIFGPDELLRLLLSQSDGKPGLAAALSQACKLDRTGRVWNGEALATELLADHRVMISPASRSVLAAFAIGGDSGMRLVDVAAALQKPPVDIQATIVELGAGGVIESVGEDRLQVRPPALRPVLVRDTFYRGPTSIDPNGLLERVPSSADTASILMSARQRGAAVPQNILEHFVRAGSRDSWEHFAWVDERCARRVVEAFPERVCAAAPGGLHWAPDLFLPRLLDALVQSELRHEGEVDHPKRRITDWLLGDVLSNESTIDRRRLLLSTAARWLEAENLKKQAATSWILSALLKPNFDVHRSKPESGREIVMTYGLLPERELRGIVELWPRILELFASLPCSVWRPFLEKIESWCFPQRHVHGKSPPKKLSRLIEGHAKRMLRDVLALPNCSRAVRTWASDIVNWCKLKLKVRVDPVFHSIFADREYSGDFQRWAAERTLQLDQIARDLLKRPPNDVVAFLRDIERDSAEFGRLAGGHDRYWIYRRLGEWCDDPAIWLAALIEDHLPAEFVAQVLSTASSRRVTEITDLVRRMLNDPLYEQTAARVLIVSESDDSALFGEAMQSLKFVPNGKFWISREGFSVEKTVRLLEHPDPDFRIAAALGEWHREGGVRFELRERWENVICEIETEEHELVEILLKNPELAKTWMSKRIQGAKWNLWKIRTVGASVAKSLTLEDRRELLLLMNDEQYDEEWFDALMDDDLQLFREWLSAQSDNYLRLRPLDRRVDDRWEKMAIIALDMGYAPEEIAQHGTPTASGVIHGPFSQYYLDQIPVYERLVNHADPRLRVAGRAGLKWVKSNAERELEREKREEIWE